MIKFNGNKDDLNKSGIYCILNLRDGKRYIGSAHNFGKRLYSHSYRLKNKKHNNPIMQNTYDKFGLDIFEFLIIEICIIDDLIKIEQRYLDDVFMINNHYDYYYNVAKSASAPMAGRKHTEESLKKMRGENHNAFGKRGEECPNFGRKQSPETIAKRKLHLPRVGWNLSEEQKRHLSEINSGEKNPNFGKKRSAETKKKISDSRWGSDNPGYISEIEAKNVETGEIKTGSSYNDIAKMFGVSKSAIQRRLEKDHEKYTERLINGCWKIYRINNEEK